MNLYYELLQYPVFSMKEVNAFYSSERTARAALGKLLKENIVLKIRNGLYTCVSGENGGPVANRFQVASAITPSSYVSHHTAFEYYGTVDQIFYEVYVGSEMRFHDFEFDGYTYHYVKEQMKEGIVSPEFSGGVRVTDKERTIVDSIKDINLIAGLEEVLSCVVSVNSIDETKLLNYLAGYDSAFLYQKIGFIFSEYQTELGISDDFIKICNDRSGNVSIFMRHEDGSVPSSDEMKKAQLQAQEQERIAWENAIPLGGKSSDVYCFDMALSVGDISDNGIGEQRKNVLKKMLSVWFVEDLDYQVEEKIQKIKTTLSSVIERYVAGEEVRIWYSYNPDELCGMYWLMKQLRPLNCQTTIYLVKLPAWEYGKENTMTSKIAWGEVSPGEWGKYITLQEKAKPVFLSACAMKWNQLQNENAPLRAMLNGKLQSVSEDIYDSFILREIAEQPEQFKMAIVIGNVLGKYQLGISDVWISNRIDKMLEDGVLEIIQDAPKGETNYRRILRKRMK